MQVINTGHHCTDVLLFLFDGAVQYTIRLPIQKQFSVMVYRHKYTWCKTLQEKKKRERERQVYWVSCIRILEYRGSKLEAQNDFGAFLLSTS